MSYKDMVSVPEKVKLLPLKARKIFKKAMKELDSIDLINSEKLPLSRPKIRAILKQMKDNLENGMSDFDEHKKAKKFNEPAEQI